MPDCPQPPCVPLEGSTKEQSKRKAPGTDRLRRVCFGALRVSVSGQIVEARAGALTDIARGAAQAVSDQRGALGGLMTVRSNWLLTWSSFHRRQTPEIAANSRND
jgi:hypothetical protein